MFYCHPLNILSAHVSLFFGFSFCFLFSFFQEAIWIACWELFGENLHEDQTMSLSLTMTTLKSASRWCSHILITKGIILIFDSSSEAFCCIKELFWKFFCTANKLISAPALNWLNWAKCDLWWNVSCTFQIANLSYAFLLI